MDDAYFSLCKKRLFYILIFSPQCQYNLLPPSLARFCPMDTDVIVYTGYGLEKCVQFYSISRKTVFRTSSLTHWPMALDVSPHGHLLAFGCQGTDKIMCGRGINHCVGKLPYKCVEDIYILNEIETAYTMRQ